MVIYNYKKIYSFPGRLFIVSSFALSPPRNYCFSIVSVDYNRRSRSPQAISQLFEWMRANFANRFPILSDKLTTLAPAEWVQEVGFSIIYSSDEISIYRFRLFVAKRLKELRRVTKGKFSKMKTADGCVSSSICE